MADFCCKFLEFRSLASFHNLHFYLPSNPCDSSALAKTHNSRINRIKKRPLHLTLLSKPSFFKPFSSDFDVISTHEHSDGSVLFRFGDQSEVAKNVKIEEPETVKEEVITDGEDGYRVVKVFDGDHEKEVMVKKAEKEVIISSESTEVHDHINSADIRRRGDVTVVEREIDSSEPLLESSNDTELPLLVSSIETEVISEGNLEEGLHEECEDSKIMLDRSSEMEEGMHEMHKGGSSIDLENDSATLELIATEASDVIDLDSLISDPAIAAPDDDNFQNNLESVVTEDIPAVLEHHNAETEMQSEIIEDRTEGFESVGISLSEEIEDENLQDGSENLIIEKGMNQSITASLEAESTLDTMQESKEDDGAGSLNVLNNAYEDLILGSERTEVDENVMSGELSKASVHELTEVESTESATTSQENLMTNFVLSSGAALLAHPSKALTGGEDAYFVASQTWLGVADGVGQWSLEGAKPAVYAQELIKNCERLIINYNENINNPVELLNLSVAETNSSGSSTVLLAQLDGQALHVANIGDSGFIVLRNGAVYKRSSPMHHVFYFPLHIERGDDPSPLAELYRVDLEEDDVIITATDGLLDNLYDQEILLMVIKSLAADKRLEEIAELLATKAQEIGSSESTRSPFADDAQAAGFAEYTGGKLDDVAVIVSVVQRQSNSENL